jgi:hypothetical protein
MEYPEMKQPVWVSNHIALDPTLEDWVQRRVRCYRRIGDMEGRIPVQPWVHVDHIEFVTYLIIFLRQLHLDNILRYRSNIHGIYVLRCQFWLVCAINMEQKSIGPWEISSPRNLLQHAHVACQQPYVRKTLILLHILVISGSFWLESS